MSNKFTYEQVKEIIEETGCELISKEYINRDTTLELKCKCGNKFNVKLKNFFKGKNTCDICSNRGIQWNKESVRDYIISHGSEFIEQEYINVDTLMKFKCQKCGKLYDVTFYNYRKHKKFYCNDCAFEISGEKQSFTQEYIENYIKNKDSELISGKYKNNTSKLKIKCVSCGKSFDTNYAKIRIREKLTCKSCSCKEANDDRRFTYDYIRQFVKENSKCKLISKEYNSNRDKLEFECSCDKHNTFKTTFYQFKYKNKRQCNECSGITKWDINMVKEFVNKNSTCELISTEFINVDEKLKFRCECGVEFDVSWDKFKGKRKQRQCLNCSSRSNLERKCKEFFDNNNIKYKREKSFKDLINPKTNGYPRYDFYLKQFNLLIECQGKQHEEETNFYGVQTDEEVKKQFEELQYRDELKRKYAEDNGIDILYIWYYELDNIPEILKNKLKLKA